MTSDLAFGLSKHMLWTAMLVAGPVIGTTFGAGVSSARAAMRSSRAGSAA